MALPGEDGTVKQHLRNIRYCYDGMGRLVSEAEGDRECTYRYDLCGNRLEKESGDGRERYTYNRKNQLAGWENQSGSWSYLYDSQGNLIRETEPGRDLHYEYNARNRQTRVLSGSGCIQENLYDGEGLCAGLSEHGKRSTFVFAGGEIVTELELGGSASRYIRGYGAAALEREGSYYGIPQDEQLSTGWITGADGKIKNGYEYDSFGNLLRNSATVPNRILYGGQQYDSETGQYYLRARYYNPVVGRFLQEDPYHGDGLNLYAYCSNNPVTYYDPSGYGREHNSRAKENVTKENVTVKQGENGSEGGGAGNGKTYSPQNVGRIYKGHGEVIDKIPINKPSGIYRGNSSDPYHYINRVTGRNVSTTDIYNTIKSPTAVLSQWKGQRLLYVGDKAAVVLNNQGELVTVWSRSDFGATLEQIFKEAH